MIILFNGPPSSGKDYCAKYCNEMFGFKWLSFKDALIDDTCYYYGVSREWFMEGYDDRSLKEKPYVELGNISKRQALIYVSEDVMKPKYGDSYYGDKIASQLVVGNYCISDSGFVEELKPIINSGMKVVVVRLVREGCTFSGDSRRYLDIATRVPVSFGHCKFTPPRSEFHEEVIQGCNLVTIHNNSTLGDLEKCLRGVMSLF